MSDDDAELAKFKADMATLIAELAKRPDPERAKFNAELATLNAELAKIKQRWEQSGQRDHDQLHAAVRLYLKFREPLPWPPWLKTALNQLSEEQKRNPIDVNRELARLKAAWEQSKHRDQDQLRAALRLCWTFERKMPPWLKTGLEPSSKAATIKEGRIADALLIRDARLRSGWDNYPAAIAAARRGKARRLIDLLRACRPLTEGEYGLLAEYIVAKTRGPGRARSEDVHATATLAESLMDVFRSDGGALPVKQKNALIKIASATMKRDTGRSVAAKRVRDLLGRSKDRRLDKPRKRSKRGR